MLGVWGQDWRDQIWFAKGGLMLQEFVFTGIQYQNTERYIERIRALRTASIIYEGYEGRVVEQSATGDLKGAKEAVDSLRRGIRTVLRINPNWVDDLRYVGFIIEDKQPVSEKYVQEKVLTSKMVKILKNLGSK